MSFTRFIKSGYLWINVLAAMILVVVLFFGLQWWLESYTHHGETITVPNLRGLTEQQVAEILQEKGLRYQISDSIYHPKAGMKAVIEQDPEPDMLVKEDRTIYLTVNASAPPKVKLPELTDLSLRQATATLESFGLKPGRLIYVPDIAYNAVLRQQVNGKDLKPGTELEKGTVVDLVLGEGLTGELVPLPNVMGMTYPEAVNAIREASFNPGAIVGDPLTAVTDTAAAKVYRQMPAWRPEAYANAGRTIDLWISQDPLRLTTPEDTTGTDLLTDPSETVD